MRYHNITKDDMLNGTGLRVVLWVSGCTHGCPGCQNPITWDINDGLIFDASAKEELFAELRKDYIEGITLSGGDPLHPANRSEIGALVEEIHATFPGKNIWIYTGFNWDDIHTLSFLPFVDVIVDGRFQIELLDSQLHWRGSSNQNVIDVKESLSHNKLTILQST
ncbi:anaerobic ribonucleoside-triphosphate reductase activating protein [Anaerocolumna sp. MB42-C2]|uniref:anaerobic ribonucleoside-triphosphate reductase activating protein n=1 Tax=Anaerocolumna sp. MB42-C2 TaxID=3070997 RepID=UPI0027DF8B0E|nr:anaerobic ribonucleoside-triphosphate reductase activating protein [Anaerocolumna sp. MB42-C2]WMJ85325.1 anaerobic ribonucleoside-triphosphate reductase activating protein [Anaerocolumna sp. MB42-C2]